MRSRKLAAAIGVINERLLRLGKCSKQLSQGTYIQDREGGKKKGCCDDYSRNLATSRSRVYSSFTCVGQIDDREENGSCGQ